MSINKGNIGNALHSVAPDHVVATADDIYDETLGKYQSELNQQIGQGGQGTVKGAKIGSGNTISPDANGIVTLPNYTENATPHIAPTSAEVKSALGTGSGTTKYLREDGTWQTPPEWGGSTPDTEIIVIDVPAASQSDIAAYLLQNVPAAQRANNIFRVPGPSNTSYSEWGWNGTAFVMLDEKDYGIDKEPVPCSSNIMTSGAIASSLGWYKGNKNDSWIYVMVDADGRFIAGVKVNGEIEWSAGVPTPIKNYVDTNLEELLTLVNGELEDKVDKMEGKGLIDAKYADGVKCIQDPVYIEVKLDADGRILEAIKSDGTKYYGGDIEMNAANITSVNDSRYLKIMLDNSGRIIAALKKDGTLVENAGIETPYIKVKKLEADEISGMSDKASLPDYYFEDDYLDNKVKDIRDAMATMNGISFGFVTDPHVAKKLPSEDASSTGGNAGYSGMLFRYVMDRLAIPFVLNGGDVPVVRADGWEPILGAAIKWHEMMSDVGKDRVFNTRGNHDYLGFTALSGDWATCGRTCTPKELYPIIMGDSHIYDVVAPTGKMYYYFDVKNTPLRIIVLDDYGDGDTPLSISGTSCIGQTQYNWLVNTALNCSNKNIVLLSHQTADPVLNEGQTDVDANRIVLHKILEALVNKTNFSYEGGGISVSKDFRNDTNTFVCHLAGHQHKDVSAKTDGVLSILQTCDCYSGYVPQGNYTGRFPGTVTEHAVSIFSVDFDTRTLKMTRIGAGEDNEWTY